MCIGGSWIRSGENGYGHLFLPLAPPSCHMRTEVAPPSPKLTYTLPFGHRAPGGSDHCGGGGTPTSPSSAQRGLLPFTATGVDDSPETHQETVGEGGRIACGGAESWSDLLADRTTCEGSGDWIGAEARSESGGLHLPDGGILAGQLLCGCSNSVATSAAGDVQQCHSEDLDGGHNRTQFRRCFPHCF